MLTDQLKRYQELALALTAQYNPEMYEPLMQEIMATDPMAAQTMAQPVQVKKQDNINPRPNEAGNVAKARAKSQAASHPQ